MKSMFLLLTLALVACTMPPPPTSSAYRGEDSRGYNYPVGSVVVKRVGVDQVVIAWQDHYYVASREHGGYWVVGVEITKQMALDAREYHE